MLADANERIKLYQTGFVDKTLTIARTDTGSFAIWGRSLSNRTKKKPAVQRVFVIPALPEISLIVGGKTLSNDQNWTFRMPYNCTSIRT